MDKRKINKPLISICIPVLNEEENIEPLLARIKNLEKQLRKVCNFEIIFTDNASNDNTWETIKKLKTDYPEIRAFKFNKNIGFQNSILFNYLNAKGDAIVQLDADLQDPPELIAEFIDHWRAGYKIVTGVRIKREENRFISFFRKSGYWIIDLVSEYPIKRNAGDFRLLDRQVVNAFSELNVAEPYLRGIISSLNLPEKDIPYKRKSRSKGESKFGMRELVKLGMTGITNHSNIPLRIANYVGGFSLIASFVGLIYYITIKFTQPNLPRGLASLYVLILFGIGVNSILLGIIGSYIKKIYFAVSGTKKYIISDSIS